MNKKVYIFTLGGVVNDVYIPGETNGVWVVIDYDDVEIDPDSVWNLLDEQDREFLKTNYPQDFEDYFKGRI